MANASFTLGMVASIADKLTTMKAGRDQANNDAGRDLVVLKWAVVDAELDKLDLKLRTVRRATRMVSPKVYDVGGAAGASLAINPAIRDPTATRGNPAHGGRQPPSTLSRYCLGRRLEKQRP
jgi:hypothetical protein